MRRALRQSLSAWLSLLASFGPADALPLGPTGVSRDLVCDLAAADPRPVAKSEARHPSICERGERARVVPVGDDRRRAVVLGAEEKVQALLPNANADVLRFWVAVLGRDNTLDVRATLDRDDDPITWTHRVSSDDGWVAGELPLPRGHATHITFASSAPIERHRDARLAIASLRMIRRPATGTTRVENVLLYVIDTLRADHLPTYGYPRNTMPRLDELAREAVVFEHAYSPAARTRPSTASLLTGQYPSRHRAQLGRGLAADTETLAEALRAHGRSTWAFVANGNVFAPGFGFDQGFDVFRSVRGSAPTKAARATAVHEAVRPLLRAHADEPFFAYIHSVDPHAPYDPPPRFAGRFRAGDVARRAPSTREALYDEELAAQDAALGELVDTLKELRLLDRTLILVVGDHGEEFFEHGGWEHGSRLYQEQIRVPAILRLPKAAGGVAGRVPSPLSLVDAAPTLLGLLGLPALSHAQGRSRADDVRHPENEVAPHPIYAEELTPHRGGILQAWIDGRWKLIRHVSQRSTHHELFDLLADPTESEDQSHDATRLHAMEMAMQDFAAQVAVPEPPDRKPARIDAETQTLLRAMGYLPDEPDSTESDVTKKNEPLRTFTNPSSGTLQRAPRSPADNVRPSSATAIGAPTTADASP